MILFQKPGIASKYWDRWWRTQNQQFLRFNYDQAKYFRVLNRGEQSASLRDKPVHPEAT